jgi:hypothetical protein
MKLEMGTPRVMDKVAFMLTDNPVEVDGVGFGFVAMKQGVFERMTSPVVRDSESTCGYENGERQRGFQSFCMKAKEAGFQIWVDPSVRVGHHKEVILTVDW